MVPNVWLWRKIPWFTACAGVFCDIPCNAQMEVAEQWRQAVLDQLENLRAQPRQDAQRSVWPGSGFGLAIPGWLSRPEGPPPALAAIDLGVVNNVLTNAVWVSTTEGHGSVGCPLGYVWYMRLTLGCKCS